MPYTRLITRICLYAVIVSCSTNLFSQSINYQFSAPNAAHHEAEITMSINMAPAGPVLVMMSRSSPGRYAKHEFGKNVYNVKATDGSGKPLPLEKVDADVYRITGSKGVIKVSYTLYANYADGTYASIDRTGYHLNMPATFMWVKGMDTAPITLQFNLADTSWKIATQLPFDEKKHRFFAPGLQYFMDSPTKVGNLQMREWKVKNTNGKQFTFRLALDGDATPSLLDQFAKKVEKIVQETTHVFGELPNYDYGTYTFLASINPFVKGDGMEHRNSTMITLPVVFTGSDDLLGVFSHEFFHCWNVERIRPADLEPFNFEKSNMSEGLWLAEGFTQYYGDLILKRAGFLAESVFINEMEGLINVKNNSPGAQKYSPVENSQRAVFTDAGVSIDQPNYKNIFASYYTYGGAIALALDLDLRNKFKGVTLDDLMKQLWVKFGKTARPYRVKDVEIALAAISSPSYAHSFFTNFIYGHQPFDYGAILKSVGYSMVPTKPGKAWAGNIEFVTEQDYLKVASNTILNTPVYNAGLDVTDVILSLDGALVQTPPAYYDVIEKHLPGDKIAIRFKHRNEVIDTTITLSESPYLLVKPLPGTTKQQDQVKQLWMKSQTLAEDN